MRPQIQLRNHELHHHTDVCVGYDTALNRIVEVIDRVRDTGVAMEQLHVVRAAGHRDALSPLATVEAALAAGAEVAGLDATGLGEEFRLYLDEQTVKNGKPKKSNIVVTAPGIDEKQIASALKGGNHEFEFDLANFTSLAPVARGGPPTARDRILASLLAHQVAMAVYADSGSQPGANEQTVASGEMAPRYGTFSLPLFGGEPLNIALMAAFRGDQLGWSRLEYDLPNGQLKQSVNDRIGESFNSLGARASDRARNLLTVLRAVRRSRPTRLSTESMPRDNTQ